MTRRIGNLRAGYVARRPRGWTLHCIVLAAASLAPKSVPAQGLASRVRDADDYYLGRINFNNVRKALNLLRDQVTLSPTDYEAWWRISKFDCYLARHLDGPEESRLLNSGVDAAKRAVALQPDRVEGHFWLGANLGLLAEERGPLRGLFLVDKIRKELEMVIKLDPDYEEAGGLRTLARLDYRVPFFKGGDKGRSIRLLQECLKRYPDDSLAMLYLADSLLAVGRREEARQMLEKILSLCPDPEYGPELADNQAEARESLFKAFHTGK